MERMERIAWQKSEAIYRTWQAAQARAVADLRCAGFPVNTVEEYQTMRSERLAWEKSRARLINENNNLRAELARRKAS